MEKSCGQILERPHLEEVEVVAIELVPAPVPTPVTFVTFTRLLRISLDFIAQIQSSFSRAFGIFAGRAVEAAVIVFTRDCNGQSDATFVCRLQIFID